MRGGTETADMVAMCVYNAQVADHQLQQARARLAKADDATDEQAEARYDIRRYLAEREHWRRMEALYLRDTERPAERKPPRLAVVPEPEPDRRLPREADDDQG